MSDKRIFSTGTLTTDFLDTKVDFGVELQNMKLKTTDDQLQFSYDSVNVDGQLEIDDGLVNFEDLKTSRIYLRGVGATYVLMAW